MSLTKARWRSWQRFKLASRHRYPFVFAVAAVLLGSAVHFLSPENKRPELYLPAIAAAAGFAYFLYNQHLQQTRLFVELFRQFNLKYDELNEDLNRIAVEQSPAMLADADRQLLFDYFNLCGEEYLYFKAGFIDEEVWRSWLQGMAHFAKLPRIRDLWASELASGSYYGFSLQLLEDPAEPAT